MTACGRSGATPTRVAHSDFRISLYGYESSGSCALSDVGMNENSPKNVTNECRLHQCPARAMGAMHATQSYIVTVWNYTQLSVSVYQLAELQAIRTLLKRWKLIISVRGKRVRKTSMYLVLVLWFLIINVIIINNYITLSDVTIFSGIRKKLRAMCTQHNRSRCMLSVSCMFSRILSYLFSYRPTILVRL